MEVVEDGVSLPPPLPFSPIVSSISRTGKKTLCLWFCGSVSSFFSFFVVFWLLLEKMEKKAKKTLWSSTLKIERRRRRRRQHHLCIKKKPPHHPSRDKNATTMDDEFVDVTSARSSASKSSFLPSSSRRKISLNTTTLLALNLVQNKKLEENTTPFEKQQEQQQKTKKKSERSVERTKTGSDATRGGFRAPPTPLSKDETNKHQRSSLLSELSGEARLLERRRRREQRNEERKQRIEERINNASPKKSTTANRLDPLAWRSLEGMVGGRVYQPQDRIVHRKKRVEVTEISTPRKGRRPWSMKNDDTHLKICMYAAAKTTKVPSPSSSKTTYTKGPMFALLQPTLVV